jgi:hypothetical protein
MFEDYDEALFGALHHMQIDFFRGWWLVPTGIIDWPQAL